MGLRGPPQGGPRRAASDPAVSGQGLQPWHWEQTCSVVARPCAPEVPAHTPSLASYMPEAPPFPRCTNRCCPTSQGDPDHPCLRITVFKVHSLVSNEKTTALAGAPQGSLAISHKQLGAGAGTVTTGMPPAQMNAPQVMVPGPALQAGFSRVLFLRVRLLHVQYLLSMRTSDPYLTRVRSCSVANTASAVPLFKPLNTRLSLLRGVRLGENGFTQHRRKSTAGSQPGALFLDES